MAPGFEHCSAVSQWLVSDLDGLVRTLSAWKQSLNTNLELEQRASSCGSELASRYSFITRSFRFAQSARLMVRGQGSLLPLHEARNFTSWIRLICVAGEKSYGMVNFNKKRGKRQPQQQRKEGRQQRSPRGVHTLICRMQAMRRINSLGS